MKNILLILAGLLIMPLLVGQGINFEDQSLDTVLSKAQEEKKLVFVDCYTSWCAPCKILDKNVFAQEHVGQFFNAEFVNIKLNLELDSLRYLAKRYNVSAFPSLLFLDANGNMIHKVVGNMKAEDLLSHAHIALNQPEKQFTILHKRYENGERDINFLSSYIIVLQQASERKQIAKVGQAFIKETPKEDYADVRVFDLIDRLSQLTCKSDVYNYFIKNKEVFVTAEGIGEERYNQIVGKSIKSYLLSQARKVDIIELKQMAEECKTDFKLSNQLMFEADLFGNWYMQHQQYDNWFEQMKNSADEMLKVNEEAAYFFLVQKTYRISKDPTFKDIENAYRLGAELGVCAKEINSEKKDVYFCLAALYKLLGDKEKALAHINTFMAIGAKASSNVDPRVEALKKEIIALP